MPIRDQFKTEKEWLEHLRLYFAGLALIGMLKDSVRTEELINTYTSRAYQYADAMLKAREEAAK